MLGVMMRSVAKRMAVATLASIMIAVFSLVTPRGPLAAADGGPGAVSADGDSGSAAGGGGSISVNVTVTYSTPGSGGGEVAAPSSSQEVSATVKPSCGYRPYRSGKNAAEFLDNGKKTSPNHLKKAWNMIEGWYPDYQSHKDDTEGYWWERYCDKDAFPDEESYDKARDEFYKGNPERVWVPAGQSGPAPYVPGAVLAKAAWEAVKIPQPKVETNPKVGSQGATLVGMDTWVWATGDTPTSVSATASVGSNSATVTASSAGLQLSAPDGKASCTGFGIAWQAGMPEGSSPCTISFNRSSAHLGGTTPLTIKVAYSASYTGSDGSSGTLPAITTTNTVNLPVAEVQTLTTIHGPPPRQI